MSDGDDPTSNMISPVGGLDAARAARSPRFVGAGRGLTAAVVATFVLLSAVLLGSTIWTADIAWRWWRAPIPTTLDLDPETVAQVVRSPTPIGSQGSWFPPDSYPAAARRANEQGRVSVKLLIEPDGTSSACEVVATSGSATLDAVTCRLAVRNGRFNPGRGREGEPVRAAFTMRNVVWRLED